jgi:DNA-binding MarR family transcriptional regulator
MDDSRQTVQSVRDIIETLTLRSMEGWRHFIRDQGLSMPQAALLMRLYHGGGAEVHDIGRHLEVTSAAASQQVERLVQEGYVERLESPEDRRVRRISLTDKGRSAVERGVAERTRWVDDLVGFIPPSSRGAVLKGLDALRAAERMLPPIVLPHVEAIKACRDRQERKRSI